jgi:hypothetical protein
MKIKLKTYKYERVEDNSIDFEIPTETSYFFETGIRRSIKIVPIYTTWQKKRDNKEEEVWKFEVTCIYLSSECIAEKFSVSVSDLEDTHLENKKGKKCEFIRSWINGFFDERTKEQYDADFNNFFTQINE